MVYHRRHMMYLRVIDYKGRSISEYQVKKGKKRKITKGDFRGLTNDRFMDAYGYLLDIEKSLRKKVFHVHMYWEEFTDRAKNIKNQEDLEDILYMYDECFDPMQKTYNAYVEDVNSFNEGFNFFSGILIEELLKYKRMLDSIEQNYNKHILANFGDQLKRSITK